MAVSIQLGLCRSCGAPILWARTKGKDKPIPLDPAPTLDGNVYLLSDGTAVYVPGPATNDARLRYISHFATCPDRDRWRKRD